MSSQKARLQHRQATAAAWAAANPILLAGELGFETDTKILRVGDGISTFTSLTPIGTLQQMGAQPVNGNLTSLSALVLAPDKGIYATGPGTFAQFDLTPAGRALLDDADAAAQLATLGLGAAIKATAQPVADANNATASGFYTFAEPFTNAPTPNAYRAVASFGDPNNGFQIAALSSGAADAIWIRQKAAGTFRPWMKILDPATLRSELNASGAAPMFACRAWVNFNGTGVVSIRGSGNVSSITDNGTGDYTINFVTPMQDANYVVLPGASVGGADGVNWKTDHVCVKGNPVTIGGNGLPVNKTAAAVQIITGHAGNTTIVDIPMVEIVIFR